LLLKNIMPLPRILVLDDEKQVRDCVRRQLDTRGYDTDVAASSSEALNLLGASTFDLVLCDLRMPDCSGIQFLQSALERHPDTGVVLMSGTHDLKLAVEAMRLGALDYVSKPFTADQIAETMAAAIARIRERGERSRHLKRLEDFFLGQGVELERTLSAHSSASEGTLRTLVAALDAREHETEAHSRRVGEYALHLAEVIGVDRVAREDIRKGALLHDIGKIGISDRILLKPGKLTSEEWVEMRKHPEIGYWILMGCRELRAASEIVIAHHERWDGTGYPNRLMGENIPLGARIFSVVDTFDALTSNRPYHNSESYESARKEIEMNAGTQFDPLVVEHFLRVPPSVWQDIRSRTREERSRSPGSPLYAATA
jgi:putative nucleotidyltransferase with HDIG domain